MHLFTFSSERVPQDHKQIIFVFGLLCGILLLIATEVFWRNRDARATYIDSYARWSWVRDQIEKSDYPRRTAILGASRILFGLSIETFVKRIPNVPFSQLAVAAKGPLATLRSLAFDSNFNGVILISFDPENLLPPRENDQQDYVDYYNSQWSLDKQANLNIGGLLQPYLVSRHSSFGINQIVRELINRSELPNSPLYLSLRANRQYEPDFSLTDPIKQQNNRITDLVRRHDYLQTIIDDSWPTAIRNLKEPIDVIQKRGGCVVLIRMPINGRWLEQDQRVFAGPKFWDNVLDELNVVGVHYNDIPEIESYPLPDAQHIDVRQQQKFTNALIDELLDLGVYDLNSSCSQN